MVSTARLAVIGLFVTIGGLLILSEGVIEQFAYPVVDIRERYIQTKHLLFATLSQGMDFAPIVALLLPPAVGGVAGYRTDGELNERLRIGAWTGVFVTIVSILGLIIYGLYGLLFAIEDPYWPDLLGFIPIFGIVGTLFIGIYAIGTATVGAVIGGYLIRNRA